MKRIRFILVTEKNIKLAIKIAKEIFPYEISNKGIFLPEEEYRLSLEPSRAKLQEFFIVRYGRQFVGITGYYYNYHIPKSNELWLGYFGVKKDCRGNGVGKKILLKTLDLMKKFNTNLRIVKLYTSSREEEKGSHHLYRCVGFKLYAHKNTRPFHTYYFKLLI